jgi:hypothetical protein
MFETLSMQRSAEETLIALSRVAEYKQAGKLINYHELCYVAPLAKG